MTRALIVVILLSDYNVIHGDCAITDGFLHSSGRKESLATVRDFVRKTPAEAPGPAHPCDAPGLSPLQFLYAVFRDRTFPMSVRIEAARILLPLTEPRPASSVPSRIGCKIIIPELPTEALERLTANHSHFSASSHIVPSHSGETQGPPILRDDTEPPNPEPFIDYSQPLSPSEIEEIKAAVDRLRPDLSHLPAPQPHLCSHCGHWMVGPTYPECICRTYSSRDPSKLN